MRETCIVVGIFILALALRTSQSPMIRKAGAFTFVAVSYLVFYFISGSNMWVGILGVLMWLFLPWVELLTRIRSMKLPMENRLRHVQPPNASFFPNARETIHAMTECGFERISDCCWHWSGMQQHHCLNVHPQSGAIASLSLCEQADVAFSFVSITSIGQDGSIWRTTNYPFAPTLLHPKHHNWNHVPCRRNCFHEILENHRQFLQSKKIDRTQISSPDPDHLDELVEEEMEEMIAYNLDLGIIEYSDEDCFRYSIRGLFFLWGQFLKDMVRLC
jgi:Ca2+/Na+ antiporter